MNKTFKCRLHRLKCYSSQEASGDEVFIVLNKKKIWPEKPFERINSMNDLLINQEILVQDGDVGICLELWERDLFTKELLGYFVFQTEGSRGRYLTDLKLKKKQDTHRYALEWEV